jgi:hypothetical protein
MTVTEGKPVCVAWLSSPFVPILEPALWNPCIFMGLGNCTPGEFGLAQVVQDRGDLFVLLNAMRALHNLAEGEDPGS